MWLNWIPGIVFRGSNAQWQIYMQMFVELIANMMKPYLARVGGPIIMAQIENEYHGDQEYVDWCGNLTVALDLNIPWYVLCVFVGVTPVTDCFLRSQGHVQRYAQL